MRGASNPGCTGAPTITRSSGATETALPPTLSAESAIGGTGGSMLGVPRPSRRSVSERGSKNQPANESMARPASSMSARRRSSEACATDTPSSRRSVTLAYTSSLLGGAALCALVVRGLQIAGGESARGLRLVLGQRNLDVVAGGLAGDRRLLLLGVESLGLGLGAAVEGQRRVLVAGHLVNSSQVVGDVLRHAEPAAVLVELDAAVGVAPQDVPAARIIGLEAYE